MSFIGDAMRTIESVVLIRSKVERLDEELAAGRSDMKELTRLVIDLSNRVARVEGYIEGASVSTARRLTKD